MLRPNCAGLDQLGPTGSTRRQNEGRYGERCETQLPRPHTGPFSYSSCLLPDISTWPFLDCQSTRRAKHRHNPEPPRRSPAYLPLSCFVPSEDLSIQFGINSSKCGNRICVKL